MPYNWYTTSLAELGFIVVQLDAMGTSYRGKKFEEVYKNPRRMRIPQTELWIKAAAKKYPYMMQIMWQSMVVRQADRRVLPPYCCMAISTRLLIVPAVMTTGWIKSGGNEQWMSWFVDSSYVECSNVENAHKLERPLMLVVGEIDDNVDPSSTYRW